MFNAGVTHAARLEDNFTGGYCLFDKDYLFLELQHLRVTNLEILPARSSNSR